MENTPNNQVNKGAFAPLNLPTDKVEVTNTKQTSSVETSSMEVTHADAAPENKGPSRATKSAVMVGIFLVLIAAIVSTIFFVPKGIGSLASVSLSSIFKPSTKIVVQADKSTVNSGDLVTLSWNGPVRTDGAYTISYPCKDGVSAEFHSGETLVCNQAFYFTSPDNTASLQLYSTLSAPVDVPLYINFKDNNNNVSIVGDTLVTVNPGGAHVSTTTPAKSTSSVAPAVTHTTSTTGYGSTNTVTSASKPIPSSTRPANTSRGVDLVAHVIAIGSLSQSNVFTPGLTVPAGSKPAIKFSVENSGSAISGPWTFKATTPSPTTPVYDSPLQPSLASGDQIQYTFAFDNSQSGGTVVISVNETHSVIETDYSNNVISYSVGGTNTGSVTTTSSGIDLSVRIGSVGYIDSNGTFVASSSISSASSTRAAIQFTVTNIGNQAANNFNFASTLPSTTNASYTSTSTASLAPGTSVLYTLAFDHIANIGSNMVTITVDPSNSIGDVNRANNSATVTINTY